MMLLYIKISDNQLIIGLTTKSKLNVLLKDRDVTVYLEKKVVYSCERVLSNSCQVRSGSLTLG